MIYLLNGLLIKRKKIRLNYLGCLSDYKDRHPILYYLLVEYILTVRGVAYEQGRYIR